LDKGSVSFSCKNLIRFEEIVDFETGLSIDSLMKLTSLLKSFLCSQSTFKTPNFMNTKVMRKKQKYG